MHSFLWPDMFTKSVTKEISQKQDSVTWMIIANHVLMYIIIFWYINLFQRELANQENKDFL